MATLQAHTIQALQTQRPALPDKDQTMNADHQHHASQAPIVTSLQVIPKLRIQFADFPYLHYSID